MHAFALLWRLLEFLEVLKNWMIVGSTDCVVRRIVFTTFLFHVLQNHDCVILLFSTVFATSGVALWSSNVGVDGQGWLQVVVQTENVVVVIALTYK